MTVTGLRNGLYKELFTFSTEFSTGEKGFTPKNTPYFTRYLRFPDRKVVENFNGSPV